MEFMDLVSSLLRWLHVVAGILWIGLLWWFNVVYTQFNALMDMETRKKVSPEILPRALYWFRWSALYTWASGVLLLLIVFYHGSMIFESGSGWGTGSYVMVAVVLLIFPVYDLLARSGAGKDLRVMGLVGIAIVALIVYGMVTWGQFSYRAYVIHTGFMFGTIMVANVWQRIWPNQKKILDALKSGSPPDPAMIEVTMQRSRHNVFLSVPLLWTMIDAHTVVPAANSWLYLIAAILVGWGAVAFAYRKAAKLKGW